MNEQKWVVVFRNANHNGEEIPYPFVWVFDTWGQAHEFCMNNSRDVYEYEQRLLPCSLQYAPPKESQEPFAIHMYRNDHIIHQWDCVPVQNFVGQWD